MLRLPQTGSNLNHWSNTYLIFNFESVHYGSNLNLWSNTDLIFNFESVHHGSNLNHWSNTDLIFNFESVHHGSNLNHWSIPDLIFNFESVHHGSNLNRQHAYGSATLHKFIKSSIILKVVLNHQYVLTPRTESLIIVLYEYS